MSRITKSALDFQWKCFERENYISITELPLFLFSVGNICRVCVACPISMFRSYRDMMIWIFFANKVNFYLVVIFSGWKNIFRWFPNIFLMILTFVTAVKLLGKTLKRYYVNVLWRNMIFRYCFSRHLLIWVEIRLFCRVRIELYFV